MIIRSGGGNSGIKEYLENGAKVDRHFSRDELDRRIPIHGDLAVSQAVIDSIQDKGQERYLHLTISFNEPDATKEKIEEVFQQYKDLLMHAYKEDEYSLYAEIHWPKIKEAYNHNSGGMEERFPHVHIVIPKKNLLTGGHLNPLGMYDQGVKYHEAIQEKLNRDNGLSSPRESPRIGSNHYESALGKYKDKELRSKNGEMKGAIYEAMVSRDVRTVDQFKEMLSEYGEVRVRNQGKDNQYFAVKAPGDQKFTNLNASIFSREFIENRNLVLPPITDSQVAKRVETWKDIQSKEIKFISNASAKVKETYRGLSLPEQRDFLAERERNYEQRHRAEQGAGTEGRRLPGLQPGGYKPSDFELAGGVPAERTSNLHELRESGVDYFDSERESAAGLLLHGTQNNDLQHIQADRDTGLRRNLYDRAGEGERRVKPVDEGARKSSVIGQLLSEHGDREAQANDLQKFAAIRKELDPAHLLAYAQIKYGVNPEDHKITRARDGSARIGAGKFNYNVSDFLTKHIGLEWREASEVLTELYEKQQAGIVSRPKTRIEHAEEWKRFREEVYPQNIKTYGELKNEIKSSRALGMKAINAEYFARRKSITNDPTLTREDKHYFRSVVIMEKLQKVEALQQEIRSQNELKNRVKYPYSTLFYDFATKNEEMNMKVLDKLKERYLTPAPEGENSMSGSRLLTPHTMPGGEEAVKRAKLVAEMRRQEKELPDAKIKVADLRPKPLTTGGVAFVHKDDGHPVFVNHPDRVEMNRNTEKEEVGVALIFAVERFGNPLEIKGTPEFKEQLIAVAAERNMDVTFTDELMNKALEAKRIELGMKPLELNSITAPGELELDKSLPLEQAADKALLDSKIVELQAINEAHAKQPVPEAEATVNRQILADAEHRHAELNSGALDRAGVEQVAKADLEAFAYLEGKPEQQELARGIGAAMNGEAYSAYMEQHGPQELKLTIDASQAIAARQPGIEVDKQPVELAGTQLEGVRRYEIDNPLTDTLHTYKTEQEAQAGAAELGSSRYTAVLDDAASTKVSFVQLDGEWKSEAAVLEAQALARAEMEQAAREQGVPTVELSAEERELVNKAREEMGMEPLEQTQPPQVEQPEEGTSKPVDPGEWLAGEIQEATEGQLANAFTHLDQPQATGEVDLVEPESIHLPSEAQQEFAEEFDEVAARQHENDPLQFVHNGEPATIDLERFQQRAQEAERLSQAVGYTAGQNQFKIDGIDRAIKELNREGVEGSNRPSLNQSLERQAEIDRERIASGKQITGVTGLDREDYVKEQAALRLSEAGLKPAEPSHEMPAASAEVLAAERAARMQAMVENVTTDHFASVDPTGAYENEALARTLEQNSPQPAELSQEWKQTISDLQEQGKLIDELTRGEENGMTTIDDMRATEIVYRLEDKEGEPRYSVEFREDGKLVAALTDLDRDELDNAVGDRNAKTIAEAGEREGKLSGAQLANEYGISPQEQDRRILAKEERKEFDAGLMRDTFKQIEVADKVDELRAVNKSFEHQESTGVDVAIRRGTLIEAEQRHDEVKAGTTESRITEIAKQDLQAFKELEGKPEQQRLALSIGNMMQNENYRAVMNDNAPEHLETTISAAQVIDKEMTAAEPERASNKDMEM